MKKCFYFFLVVFMTSSCTEDVKFNNPAFQTLKNNVFWKGQSYQAYLGTDGTIIIEGSSGFEKVILHTASSTEKTYVLGINDISKASYSNTYQEQFSVFSTGTNKGDGHIVITDFDVEMKTITGTFKFNATNSDESDTENANVNFTEGVFYKVPVSYTSAGVE